MDDTELKTIFAMRCKEDNKEMHKRLIDRMDHMSDDPDALLKHFTHLFQRRISGRCWTCSNR